MNTKPKVDVAAIVAKARNKTNEVKKSLTVVESKKDDYRLIPGFKKYEINSMGIVRSVGKKQMQSKKATGKFQLFNDKGERPNLSLEQIMALFPTEVKVAEPKIKKEKVVKEKTSKISITALEIEKITNTPGVAEIVSMTGPKHAIQYKLHLLGIDVQAIMALTKTPYNATKRNIWYYTSGKKTI